MITVINENDYLPFDGMSIDEACAHLEMCTSEALNEMKMDILLTEHAYLHETGCDLEYVSEGEDGYMYVNEAGTELGKKIIGTLHYIWDKIKEMFTNMIEWIKVHVMEIQDNLRKIGINKKNYALAVNAVYKNGVKPPKVKVSKAVNIDGARYMRDDSHWYTAPTATIVETQDLVEKYISSYSNPTEDVIDKNQALDAGEYIFNKDSVIGGIRKQMKDANKALNDLEKKVKSENGDDSAQEIEQIGNAARNNSNVASFLIKVHHLTFKNNVAVARAVLKHPAAKNAIHDNRIDTMSHPIKSAKRFGKSAKEDFNDRKEAFGSRMREEKNKLRAYQRLGDSPNRKKDLDDED